MPATNSHAARREAARSRATAAAARRRRAGRARARRDTGPRSARRRSHRAPSARLQRVRAECAERDSGGHQERGQRRKRESGGHFRLQLRVRMPARRPFQDSTMTIERRHVGKRLSDLVIYAPAPGSASSISPARSPRIRRPTSRRRRARCSTQIDRAARRSRHRQDADPVGDDLPRRHGRLRGDERRVGSVGRRRARRRRARPSRRSSPIPLPVEIQVVAARRLTRPTAMP